MHFRRRLNTIRELLTNRCIATLCKRLPLRTLFAIWFASLVASPIVASNESVQYWIQDERVQPAACLTCQPTACPTQASTHANPRSLISLPSLGLDCGRHVSNKPPFDRFKRSFVQLWETEAAYISSGDEFDLSEVNTTVRFAIPLNGSMDNMLGIQPGLRTYHLNGPSVVDVPETLYDAQVSLLWRREHSERWQTNVWLQPKVRSDFETSDNAFFFSGGFFAKYVWRPNVFDLYLGALYLDRDDISILPAVGFVWTPTPDWRYELLLPRPKIAKRISRNGDCWEKWAYLSGQLGGGSFAVERAAGNSDKVTVRDLRLMLGVESVRPGGGGRFVELGYVFNRGIEYERNDEEYEFDDAFMLRGGIRF